MVSAGAFEIGAGGERMTERECEGGEAGVVQPPPAALPDPFAHAERCGEREHQPARDDAGGYRDGAPGTGERREHGGQSEVHGGIEQQRSCVKREHRESGPGKGLVPAEEGLLSLRAEQASAHRQSEPDRQREDAEGDETGGAGDVPRDRRLCEERVHRTASIGCVLASSGSTPIA